MYGDQKSAIDSLSPVNINQVNANLMDADQIQSIVNPTSRVRRRLLKHRSRPRRKRKQTFPGIRN